MAEEDVRNSSQLIYVATQRRNGERSTSKPVWFFPEGDKIFFTSYGSGAGSDSMSLVVTDRINEVRKTGAKVADYLERKHEIRDYGVYLRLMNEIHCE